MAEWLIAPVLKTGRPQGLVSSNLTPSAKIQYAACHLMCHFLSREQMKIRTHLALELDPRGIAFDGANIWVTNGGDPTVSKL